MPSSSEPGALLTALDASILDFRSDCALRFEAQAGLASRDIALLSTLAERLAINLAEWAGVTRSMDMAIQEAFAPHRAGQLVVECVFEDALTPTAACVLSAALNIALERS